jgi:hypothetical protein
MRLIRSINIGLILTLCGIAVLAPTVLAETEPNDSEIEAEIGDQGTFSGSVNATDVDFYRFTVPGKKDILVTAKKTDAGTGIISITGYDKSFSTLAAISLTLTVQEGEKQDSDWNIANEDAIYYLEIEGDGDYEFTVEYTDDSQEDVEEAVEGLFAACGIVTLLSICLPIGFIIAVIIVVLIIIKVVSKKK